MEKKGVTIIEAGVVIALIGLTALLLSPFVRIVREKSNHMRCINNLQRISIALREYSIENNETPPGELNTIYKEGYLDDEKVFDCPFSSKIGKSEDSDYDYAKNFDFTLADNPAIVYDRDGNHQDRGGNVLYLNGEIKQVNQ